MDTTNVETYARQHGLNLYVPASVAIVGCGGVGTWVAIELALAGVRLFDLYDSDILQESNRGRMPYAAEDVGKPKTRVLADLILKLRPDVSVYERQNFDPGVHNFQRAEVVVAATDTMASRQEIADAAKHGNALYIDVGANGHRCTLSTSPADWAIEEDRVGYFTPSYVAPVVLVASLAVAMILGGGMTAGTALYEPHRQPLGGTSPFLQFQPEGPKPDMASWPPVPERSFEPEDEVTMQQREEGHEPEA